MRTRAIHAGDLVLVNHLGRVFYAKLGGSLQAGVVAIEPLDRRVSYRSAKAREIVDHWAHSTAGHDERVPVLGPASAPSQRTKRAHASA